MLEISRLIRRLLNGKSNGLKLVKFPINLEMVILKNILLNYQLMTNKKLRPGDPGVDCDRSLLL